MKLAVICGGSNTVDGNDTKALQFIDNSLEKVQATLNNNAWIAKTIRIDTLDNYQTWLANICKDKKITEFLFYYTGHGIEGSRHTQAEFRLRFQSEKPTIGALIDDTKKALGGRFPSKMALVIDSCYSGEVIAERVSFKTVELLTSTNDRTKSFEKKGLVEEDPEYGISVFSHYFCQAFEVSHDVDVDLIDFETIQTYVGKSQEEQKPYHLKALERDKITIGYNKEINDIRDTLKKSHSHKELKEKALLYFNAQTPRFDDLVNAKSFDDMFNILLFNQNCLFCLLKELSLTFSGLKKVDEDFDCNALQNKVQESRKIIGVILKIEMEDNDNRKCRVSGWKRLNSQQYRPIAILKGLVDFSKEVGERSYVESLTKYLKEKVLEGAKPQAQLELELMLPYKLFAIDFDGLKFEAFQTWNQAFNISKRFLATYDDYFLGDRLDDLKRNSKKHTTFASKAVKELDCLELETAEDTNNIDRYNDGDKNYILLTSNHNLTEERKLMEIQYYGIPKLITPNEPYSCMAKDIDFKDKCLKEMNGVLFSFVKDHRKRCKIHFIYDKYDDLKYLTQ